MNPLKRKIPTTDEKEASIVNDVYRTLRYWIQFDGDLKTYADNYSDPRTRYHRIMFLEEEHTTHNTTTQDFINCTFNCPPNR